MQINKEVLKSLNPCADRYKHFLEHNADFDGSFNDFLDLPNVDYNDKVWVAEKALNKNQSACWATLCAESVVSIFEAKYPKDKRLSNCINFIKSINDFDNLTNAQVLELKRHISAARSATFAAHYALHTADATIEAAHAVYCALYTAYYALYAVNYAANSAVYATTAARDAINAALLAAADTGEDANAAGNNQQELNIQFLRMACSL